MVAFAIKNFGGEVPRTESRNLPDNNAEQAVNCDLASGVLEGLPIPELIIDFNIVLSPPPGPGGVERAYRLPAANPVDPTAPVGPDTDAWLPLPSPFSSACRSPLANDSDRRVYWTNPGDRVPWWSTYDDIRAGTPPFNLGMVYPDPVTDFVTVTATGGTTDGSIPFEARSYLYTFVDIFGEESAPSAPSIVVNGPPDAVWEITGLPISPPANPAGVNYPAIKTIRLYRTVTGATSGAQFYFDFLWAYPAGGGSGPPLAFIDPFTADELITDNIIGPLVSTDYANPVPFLDGLTSLPGGMLVGFTGNTVHFCEPDHPHTWPAAYDQSLQFDIVGFGVWQQSLVVMTSGYPSTGSGNSPSNYVFTQVGVPEPCIARGSIITDLMGVYYASQNGLVMLNYFGMQNQTLSTMTKNTWLNEFNARDIIACRHRSQYLAINATGAGFIIDYAEQRLGFMPISPAKGAVCVWNDPYTGDAYICANNRVYRWDSPNTGPLTYRWRSKQFYGAAPMSLAAVQVSLDPAVETPYDPGTIPMDNGDPTLVLPAGARAVFNVYAGPDGRNLILSRVLTTPREIFRLPSGFKSFDWQCEIIANVGVRSIEMATSMRELKGV